MDYKLELVLIPVSDVDRAKAFYAETAGFRLDVDHHAGDEFRVVQLTPPGSACSIAFGIGVIDNTSAPVRGLHLVGTDIGAARADLSGRGVEVSEIRYMDGGWKPGVDPNHANYNCSPISPIPTATPGCCRRSDGARPRSERNVWLDMRAPRPAPDRPALVRRAGSVNAGAAPAGGQRS
ncbi:MAG TPA: hypothetical protein VGC11_08775 [Acidimicrobiia bacterium]